LGSVKRSVPPGWFGFVTGKFGAAQSDMVIDGRNEFGGGTWSPATRDRVNEETSSCVWHLDVVTAVKTPNLGG